MATLGSAFTDKQKYADLLFAGQNFPYNLYNKIVPQVLTAPNIEKDIRTVLCNLRRVETVNLVLSPFNLKKKFKPVNDAFRKDDELAETLCKRGDEKSAKADIDGSMRYYNLALLAAPAKGTRIGEIYGRRAAMSLTLKDHKSCLKDVEMALKHDIQPKIKERMIKIRKELVRVCSLKEDESDPDYLDRLERKMYRDEVMYRVDGPSNPKIPVAAECIEIVHNKQKGRHVVSNADLAPGTTIIVENPYVNLLEDTLHWDTQHCAACCKRSTSLIPCDCMFVMYCDEKCKLNGFKNGHVYECKCLPLINVLRTNWLLHTAFVAVCRAGPVELRDRYIASKKKTLSTWPITRGEQKGFNPETGIYETDSYYQISKLHSYLERDELPILTVVSVILAHVLDFKTNFFDAEPKGPQRNGFISYVASRILFHANSFSVNSFGLNEKVADKIYPPHLHLDLPTEDGPDIKNLSTVVYPFISLLSHSCYPNAVCEHMTNGRMAIITNQLIKAGEEVTITYGFLYWRHEIAERRAKMNASHHFLCYCIACISQWPKNKGFNNFLCPNCSGEFHYDDMYKHCVLTPNKRGNGFCRNCKSEVNLRNLEDQVVEYEKKYSKACLYVLDKKPLQAIPIILDCIQFFQKNLCPPSIKIINATALLGQAHGLIYTDLD